MSGKPFLLSRNCDAAEVLTALLDRFPQQNNLELEFEGRIFLLQRSSKYSSAIVIDPKAPRRLETLLCRRLARESRPEEQILNEYFTLLQNPGCNNTLARELQDLPQMPWESSRRIHFCGLTPELAGTLHEYFLAGNHVRRRQGSFFTPQPLVERLLDVLEEHLPEDHLQILDPAVGAGAFLIGAARRWGGRKNVTLSGGDIDPVVLKIARWRLEHFRQQTGKNFQLEFRQQNFLTAQVPENVDLVLSNPPFIQLCAIPREERKILRKNFQLASGRFNSFSLFLEQIAKTIASSNGRCGMVLPDRLLFNTQYTNCRQALIHQWPLEFLESLPKRQFRAAVDNILLTFSASTANGTTQVLVNGRKRKRSELLHPASGQFQLDFDPQLQRILQKISDHSIPFGKLAQTRDGIIQSKVGDALFVRTPGEKHYKLLFGRNITPGKIAFAGDYVYYVPEFMQQLEHQRGGSGLRLRTPEIFQTPKILTRQTADRIIAAYDCNGEYFYANTLHGSQIKDPTMDPCFLVLALNSKLVNFYYRNTARESGCNFAQVKIALLRLLPIPAIAPEKQQKLLALHQNNPHAFEHALALHCNLTPAEEARIQTVFA